MGRDQTALDDARIRPAIRFFPDPPCLDTALQVPPTQVTAQNWNQLRLSRKRNSHRQATSQKRAVPRVSDLRWLAFRLSWPARALPNANDLPLLEQTIEARCWRLRRCPAREPCCS